MIIESVTTTNSVAAETTPNVNFPATVNAGDGIVMVISVDNDGLGGPTITGWDVLTALDQNTDNSNGTLWGVGYLVAAGTEGGGTIDLTLSASLEWTAHVFRLTEHNMSTNPPEMATEASFASSTAPDPPDFNPVGWGTSEIAVIAAAVYWNGGNSVSGYPTSYINNNDTTTGAANGDANLGTATRILTAASENPAAFTLSLAGYGDALTIMIEDGPEPSAGGGTLQGAIAGREDDGLAGRGGIAGRYGGIAG